MTPRPLLLLLLSWCVVSPAWAQKSKDDEPFQHLKFRLVGPSAGGRVSRACGIAGDPSTYYLGAASGGVWKTTDGGHNWKPIFDDQPTSSIGAVAVAPSDVNVVFVGSGEANIRGNVAPGNGIYKSSDGGKSWKHVWKQPGQIGHIVVHPKNADIAFAAVLGNAFGPNPQRGVYRTTDGGKTWQQVLSSKVLVKSEMVKAPIVPPPLLDPKGMVISRPPAPPEFKDVLEETWDYPAGAIDVCFDPNNPRILFAALWQARRSAWDMTSGGPGSGMYRSDDGGDTWKKLGPKKITFPVDEAKKAGKKIEGKKMEKEEDEDNGLPEGVWGRVGIAVAPSDSERVYAIIEAEKGGLYRSDDGGKKWERINGERYLQMRPWYFSVIRVDPKNADVIYSCGVRLLKSTDGGKSFKNLKGPHHVDHHDLWIDPTNPDRMIDSNDGGVDITLNGGGTWHAPMLPISQFYHITCDNSVPYRVMGNMQDLGTASGPSNSLRGGGIMLHEWHTVGGGETGISVPDPSDPNIVYSGEYMGIITRYDRRTKQARHVSIYPITSSGMGAEALKFRFQWTAPIMISPHDAKTIYHAANVLFRSSDQGATWKAISPDLTRDDKSKQKWSGGPITGDNTGAENYCTIFAIAESPVKRGVLWAGSDDGLVHVSADDGKTWTNVTKNIEGMPEWATVTCIEASRRDAGTAYVVADTHRLPLAQPNRPYLWKTSDFGKTWKSLTAGRLPSDDYLRVVREDPVVPGMLYLGSENGLYYSRDDGVSWRKLKLNFPTVAVCDLVVKDNDLVVGTNGRSIWILDDLTPLRFWPDKDAALDKARLFPIASTIRWRYGDDGHTPDDRHPGANPPAGAVIHYYLPVKPKDEIVLEILDAKGSVVRKMTSKKAEPADSEDHPDAPWSIFKPTVLATEPGIQRLVWDLRCDGPTVIPKAKNDSGVPRKGFLMPPGIYMLKLQVDGVTFTQKVEVQPDPRLKASKDELAKLMADNFTLSTQLRDDITTLSKTVIALQAVRKQLQERMPLWEKEDAAKKFTGEAKKLIAGLDALEAKLHNPKAEVAYDILAMKGGAKLYSQLATLYNFVTDSDGPVTQGMRDTYAEWSHYLKAAMDEWRGRLNEIRTLNESLSRAGVGHVLPPP